MIKAVLCDFYGTLAHEDDAIIPLICDKILRTASKQVGSKEIGDYWWNCLSSYFSSSYCENFHPKENLKSDRYSKQFSIFNPQKILSNCQTYC